MTRVSEVQAQVASRYGRLSLPTWPNPHPGMAPPRDDEYSRLTEPGRYAIVHARARVWTEVLRDAALAQVERLAAGSLDVAGHPFAFERGTRLTPSQPGGLTLLLLETDVRVPDQDVTLSTLHVCVERPDVPLAMLPDCGCDACDSGSEDLLEAVDQTVSSVVGGPFVVVRGPGWQAHWFPDGGGSGGDGRGPDHRSLMELCRRLAAGEPVPLADGAEAFVGGGWLG